MPVRTLHGNKGPSSLRSAEAQKRAAIEFQRKLALAKAEQALAAAEIAERTRVAQLDTLNDYKPSPSERRPFKPSRVVDIAQERDNLRDELMAAISDLPTEKQAEILKRASQNTLTEFQLDKLLGAK